MYLNLVPILREGADNDNVSLTVLSGVGEYYSSGTDLGNNTDELSNEGKYYVLFEFILLAWGTQESMLFILINFKSFIFNYLNSFIFNCFCSNSFHFG